MSALTTIKGLEQSRAKFAFEKAEVIAKNNQDSDKAKEYKSYAKKLPMMIKVNGLGAAISFAFAKRKNKEGRKTAWGEIYYDLNEWLRKDENKWLLGNEPASELAEAVIELNSQEYRALTLETLAFLNWLRRFAEGLIEGDADEQN